MTDTTFAAGAKQAAELTKGRLRRRLRLKAWQQGVPPKLRSGPMEIMQIACAMHADFVKRSEGGAVVKALRSAHFLDWLPGDGGLVKVSEEDSLLWPAGGSRVDPSWTETKEAWMQPVVNQAGERVPKPFPTDWSVLNNLRSEQENKKKREASKRSPCPSIENASN